MAYRGYLALNHVEIANSARVVAHLGGSTPTVDLGYFNTNDGSYDIDPDAPGVDVHPLYDWVFQPGVGFVLPDGVTLVEHPEFPTWYLLSWAPCTPIQSTEHPGFGLPMDGQIEISEGLWTPPPGARIFGPGLFIHDQCWGDPAACSPCRSLVAYDDTWPGQREWLGDVEYRPELAPWYTSEIPESGEFGGVWVMDIQGLDSTPTERSIVASSGSGAVAGPNRDGHRTVTVDALLLACSNAGVEYGLKWLTGRLRATTKTQDLALRYLTASPANTAADPDTLVREAHNVVMTSAPHKTGSYNIGSKSHQHGTVYRVTWELTILSPYSYLPPIDVPVEWDRITRQPINWIHAADCAKPETCLDMPVMFSATCVPEEIERIETLPPVCGGCLPVSAIDKYQFRVPTMEYAFRGRETAVSLVVKNTGMSPLTLQAFWRVCGSDVRCEDNQFPLSVSGLPPGAELHLDGITGRFRAWHDEMWRRPVGIVGTPNGAPWRPPVVDRQTCWDFIVQTASTSSFAMTMSMADREP